MRITGSSCTANWLAASIQDIAIPAYQVSTDGVIVRFNEAVEHYWGRRPTPDGRWSGAAKLYDLRGEPLPPAKLPIARAVRGEPLEANTEVVLETPTGERRTYRP